MFSLYLLLLTHLGLAKERQYACTPLFSWIMIIVNCSASMFRAIMCILSLPVVLRWTGRFVEAAPQDDVSGEQAAGGRRQEAAGGGEWRPQTRGSRNALSSSD